MKKKRSQKKPSAFSGVFSFLILFAIAAVILNYFAPIIPFLIAVVIIAGVGYMLLKLRNHRENASAYSTDNLPTTNSLKLQNDSIKRQLAILTESTELVNNSNNLDTVLRRYSIICNTLEKLSTYTDYEIRNAGYSLKEPLSNTLRFMQDNKITFINQAIERNIKHELNSLKTTRGKMQKLDKLYEDIKEKPGLEKTNLAFLEKLYSNIKVNYS